MNPNGFHKSLGILTTNFRNRAAHIDELAKVDYVACREQMPIASPGDLPGTFATLTSRITALVGSNAANHIRRSFNRRNKTISTAADHHRKLFVDRF